MIEISTLKQFNERRKNIFDKEEFDNQKLVTIESLKKHLTNLVKRKEITMCQMLLVFDYWANKQIFKENDVEKSVLFICLFGQSRSKYFAEEYMKLGNVAMYGGIEHDGLIEVDFNLMAEYDIIVFLDKEAKEHLMQKRYVEWFLDSEIIFIDYFIDDNPILFDEKFKKFLPILENAKNKEVEK